MDEGTNKQQISKDKPDDDDYDELQPGEEYWEAALELPIPLRIKIHENVLKLLVFSHHPYFPMPVTALPATPPMLIRALTSLDY